MHIFIYIASIHNLYTLVYAYTYIHIHTHIHAHKHTGIHIVTIHSLSFYHWSLLRDLGLSAIAKSLGRPPKA